MPQLDHAGLRVVLPSPSTKQYILGYLIVVPGGDVHRLPVQVTEHAAFRLRFKLRPEEFLRVLKTATVVRVPRKEGAAGVMEARVRLRRMRIVYTVRRGHLIVITVEEVGG